MRTEKQEEQEVDHERWTLRMAARELERQCDGAVSEQRWRAFLTAQIKLGALPYDGRVVQADDVNDVLDLDEIWSRSTPRLPSAMREDEVSLDHWDDAMHAARWLGLSAISPHEAASLLCGVDPLNAARDPAVVTTDETTPEDFKLLLRVFSDAHTVDPAHRRLRHWFEIAKASGCKQHSWLESYLAIRQRLGYSAFPSDQPKEAADDRRGDLQSPTIPRQRAQEIRILELVATMGFNPLGLPSRKPGARGVKAEAKKLALREPAVFTGKTFDTAWQRLRDDGRLVGG